MEAPVPAVTSGPSPWARPSFRHGFPGSALTPPPGGTLRCPANHPSISRNDAPSAMGPCGSWMPLASAMAVPGLLPGAGSRKRHHAEPTTGECGGVAAQGFSRGLLASC